jgi:Gene product 67
MNDTIEELINTIHAQDFANAGPMFAELMATRLGDAIDAEKIKVAGQMFNGEGDDPVTDEDVDNVNDDDFDEEDYEDLPEE